MQRLKVLRKILLYTKMTRTEYEQLTLSGYLCDWWIKALIINTYLLILKTVKSLKDGSCESRKIER